MREQGVSSLIVTRRDSDDETQMLPLTTGVRQNVGR